MNKGLQGIAVFKDGTGLKIVKDTPHSICKEIAKHKTFPIGKLVYQNAGKIISRAYTKSEFKADVNYILKHKIGFTRESLIHLCKLAKIVVPKEIKEIKVIKKKKTTSKRR